MALCMVICMAIFTVVIARLRKKSTEAEPKACFNDGVVNGYLVTVSYSKFTAGFSIFSIFLFFFKKKSKN